MLTFHKAHPIPTFTLSFSGRLIANPAGQASTIGRPTATLRGIARPMAIVAVAIALALVAAPRALSAAHPGEFDAALQPTQDSQAARERMDETSQLLEPNAFVSRPLGIEFHPPRGAHVEAQRGAESRVTILVAEDSDNPRWSMRLQTLASALEDPSPEGEIDDHLQALEARGAEFRVISRRSLVIDGKDAHECFIEQMAANRESYVAGWLIVSTGPGTYLAITSLTLPEHLPDIQPIFDASLATLKLRTVDETNRETMRRMLNGQQLLEQVDQESLRKFVDTEFHLRTFIPAGRSPGGQEVEIGWATVRMTEAKRGVLNPRRNEFDYDMAEHELGFVAFVQAQMIERHTEPRITSDIEAVYWLAWDLKSEQWSVRATRRQGEGSMTTAETGLLIPASASQPRSVLIVSKPGPGRETPSEWTVPAVYFPQALRWVMPQLLPRDVDEPIEFGWFAYNHTAPQPAFTRRIDRWEPDGSAWKLTTWLAADDEPTRSEFDAAGKLIRMQLPSGAITEVRSLDAIHNIWQSKGLLRRSHSEQPTRRQTDRIGR